MSNTQLKHRQIPFILLTVAVALILVGVTLVQHGMFMDGTQYAVVAKNLAEGKGSFWFPYLSSGWERHGQTAFLEHPPLVYWLQSFFFELFNGSIYSERLYSMTVFILCALVIAALWKRVFINNPRYQTFWWLPVLTWVITPSVYWCYTNNMLESTVSLFVLCSVYFFIRAMQTLANPWVWIILSSAAIFMASLSKGLQGLFTLSLPLLAFMMFKDFPKRKMIAWALIMLGVVTMIYISLVMMSEDAQRSLTFYVKERLLYRVNETAQVENRFAVLWWLFTELLVPSILVAIIYFTPKVLSQHRLSVILHENEKKWAIFFLCIGFAGVVPLTLTYVQRAVYFVPALPFFAMTIATLMLPRVHRIVDHLSNKSIKALTAIHAVVLCSVLFWTGARAGNVSRDESVLNEVHALAEEVPEHSIIGVPYSIYDDWDFQFYLLRYHNIELNPYPGEYAFKLLEKDQQLNDPLYKHVEIGFANYELFQKITQP